MLNSYNLLAPFYSGLSRLMFGNSLIRIQQKLIDQLPKSGSLVIVGGGDGNILHYLFNHAPLIKITYIDSSSTMIELAKRRAPRNQNITFNHSDNFLNTSQRYDFIFMGFFLDLFTNDQVQNLISKANQKFSNPTWFVADFNLIDVPKHKWFRKIQLKMSIIFFKFTTNHINHSLPSIFKIFTSLNHKSLNYSILKNNFLRAEVFKL